MENIKRKIRRSPLFYVGDKYKLLEEISLYFPKKVNKFIEPFAGGGTVFLNINADEYLLNDIDPNVIMIHKFLLNESKNVNNFFKKVYDTAVEFNLSRSYKEDRVPEEMKHRYKKTYYAKYNKEGYGKLKKEYNDLVIKDPFILYLLLIYGFNRMLRFNSKGEFNVPVGNVDFNNNVKNSLVSYFDFVKNKKITWSNKDFLDFLNSINYDKDDFIYLDPPYLISFSEYNKLWDENEDRRLLKLLDILNRKGINFAISNIILHKGKRNAIFIEWMKGYNVYKIKSNYISYHDNGVKKIEEVLVTNYEKTCSRI
jgi:DNA adenine methylase